MNYTNVPLPCIVFSYNCYLFHISMTKCNHEGKTWRKSRIRRSFLKLPWQAPITTWDAAHWVCNNFWICYPFAIMICLNGQYQNELITCAWLICKWLKLLLSCWFFENVLDMSFGLNLFLINCLLLDIYMLCHGLVKIVCAQGAWWNDSKGNLICHLDMNMACSSSKLLYLPVGYSECSSSKLLCL